MDFKVISPKVVETSHKTREVIENENIIRKALQEHFQVNQSTLSLAISEVLWQSLSQSGDVTIQWGTREIQNSIALLIRKLNKRFQDLELLQ